MTGRALAVTIHDPLQLQHAHLAVDGFVQRHHRSEGAAAEAHHSLQVVLAVRRRFPSVHPEATLQSVEHLHAALDVAGGAEADAQPVLAGRREAELGVESGDAVDLAL